MGINTQAFSYSITHKTRETGKTLVKSPLKLVDCISLKDSFCKELYNRLFNWIVIKLNKVIKP